MLKKLIISVILCFAFFISFSQSGADTTYQEASVVLHTATGNLYGTLTTPVVLAKAPLAIIIAGSGPTDRNCNNPAMKTDAYKQLAYALASNNIASLRYDKRGIGESKEAIANEKDIRFEDYVADAKDWVALMKKDRRFTDIIIIGHSEGSLIGMLSSANDVNKFISIAGVGQTADKTLKEQLSSQPEFIKDIAFSILDSLSKGVVTDSVPRYLYSLFRPEVQPYLISWFKKDPSEIISHLNIPVLILQGTNDIQVSVEDANRLKAASPSGKLVLIPGMNHILKKVPGDKTENIKSYNNPSLPIDEELVKNIVSFIL